MIGKPVGIIRSFCFVVILTLTVVFIGNEPLFAQSAISAEGVIESELGGFKFPDGTIQDTAAVPGFAPVIVTGMTLCFDPAGVNSIPCSGTGQDGELQAGVDWPDPRFTDNGDGTVRDNLTDLDWLKDANCPDSTKTWQEALDWIKLLNTTTTTCIDYSAMTYTDWRLPNIKELLTLVDYSQFLPPLPAGHPFESVTGNYWTSTTSGQFLDRARSVGMNVHGGIGSSVKTEYRSVWAVRGGN